MERFLLPKIYCKQAERWNCSLVATTSNWASSFNLHFCFLSVGVTSCSDHSLETFCFTPTCLERKLFFHCSHTAKCCKKRSQNGNPEGQVLSSYNGWGKSLEKKGGRGWTGNFQNPQHFPLPFTAAAAAATKVVVCFVFVKLCILWRLYCCKKCWKKKKK